jgi:hypothetical protein
LAKTKILFSLLAGWTVLTFSCQEPVPLYGKWADNRGNTITFSGDGTFSAAITYADSTKIQYSGTWSILQNSLSMNGSGDDETVQIVSEWDIRGNMLYLTWAAVDETILLTLYKISN